MLSYSLFTEMADRFSREALLNISSDELVMTLTGEDSCPRVWRPSGGCSASRGPPEESETTTQESGCSYSAVEESSRLSVVGDSYIWSRRDTLLLLTLIREHQEELSDKKTRKSKVWYAIATKMIESGYKVTGQQCNSRWKTLKASFRRTVDHNRLTGIFDTL